MMKKENINDIPDDCYGYCPICNKRGVIRERSINGNDRCIDGHIYKSKDALEHNKNLSKL